MVPFPVFLSVAAAPIESVKLRFAGHFSHDSTVYDGCIRVKVFLSAERCGELPVSSTGLVGQNLHQYYFFSSNKPGNAWLICCTFSGVMKTNLFLNAVSRSGGGI